MKRITIAITLAAAAWAAGELESARDRQDRAALEKLAAQPQAGDDAAAHYRTAQVAPGFFGYQLLTVLRYSPDSR